MTVGVEVKITPGRLTILGGKEVLLTITPLLDFSHPKSYNFKAFNGLKISEFSFSVEDYECKCFIQAYDGRTFSIEVNVTPLRRTVIAGPYFTPVLLWKNNVKIKCFSDFCARVEWENLAEDALSRVQARKIMIQLGEKNVLLKAGNWFLIEEKKRSIGFCCFGKIGERTLCLSPGTPIELDDASLFRVVLHGALIEKNKSSSARGFEKINECCWDMDIVDYSRWLIEFMRSRRICLAYLKEHAIAISELLSQISSDLYRFNLISKLVSEAKGSTFRRSQALSSSLSLLLNVVALADMLGEAFPPEILFSITDNVRKSLKRMNSLFRSGFEVLLDYVSTGSRSQGTTVVSEVLSILKERKRKKLRDLTQYFAVLASVLAYCLHDEKTFRDYCLSLYSTAGNCQWTPFAWATFASAFLSRTYSESMRRLDLSEIEEILERTWSIFKPKAFSMISMDPLYQRMRPLAIFSDSVLTAFLGEADQGRRKFFALYVDSPRGIHTFKVMPGPAQGERIVIENTHARSSVSLKTGGSRFALYLKEKLTLLEIKVERQD